VTITVEINMSAFLGEFNLLFLGKNLTEIFSAEMEFHKIDPCP
jgi:hypothetical protein